MKIQNTKSIGVGPIKMIVFGEAGAGKTSLAKTIKEKTLIVSAESGLLSLHGSDIDVVDISQDDDGNAIPKEKRINRLGEVYKFLQSDESRKRYSVVFIDSLTEINQNLLEALQVEFPDPKDTLKLYGELSKRMRSLVKMFRDLPGYSVVFTALSEFDKDEEGKRFTGIQLVGKFAAQLPAFFDEVLYLHVEAETGERKLVSRKSDRLVAKDRSGRLLPVESADLGLIFSKIRAAAVPAVISKEKSK